MELLYLGHVGRMGNTLAFAMCATITTHTSSTKKK